MIREFHHVVYVVRCNLCGHQSQSVVDGHGTPEAAYDYALRNGWLLNELNGKAFDLCKDCQ